MFRDTISGFSQWSNEGSAGIDKETENAWNGYIIALKVR